MNNNEKIKFITKMIDVSDDQLTDYILNIIIWVSFYLSLDLYGLQTIKQN